MTSLPIQFRPGTQADLPLIKESWLKSMQRSAFARDIMTATYEWLQNMKIDTALNNPTTQVTIAHLENDSDCVFGYVIHDKTSDDLTFIHFLYVKYTYRRNGIARKLLAELKPSVPVIFNDITYKFLELRDQYNLPYISAAQLEAFQNKPDWQTAFADWLRGRYYQHQQLKKEIA